MIDLWYFDISQCSEETFNRKLSELPIDMRNQVTRYRFMNDQKLKLFARILVKEYILKQGRDFSWDNWQTDESGKPKLCGDLHFNISHSNEIVVVAFSSSRIGVDVENRVNMDVNTLTKFLHAEETNYITNSNDPLESMFRVWTRKEAYLKAIGTGIVNGLNEENCLLNPVWEGTTWYIYSLEEIEGYALAVCSEVLQEMKVREVKVQEFMNER